VLTMNVDQNVTISHNRKPFGDRITNVSAFFDDQKHTDTYTCLTDIGPSVERLDESQLLTDWRDTKGQTFQMLMTPILDEKYRPKPHDYIHRDSWKAGSELEIFSLSAKKWYRGNVSRVHPRSHGDDLLEVSYKKDNGSASKNVHRYQDWLRQVTKRPIEQEERKTQPVAQEEQPQQIDVGDNPLGAQPPKPTWQCTTCTLLNENMNAPCCAMCQNPRSKPAAKEWKCATCTFLNKDMNESCEMCQGPKSGSAAEVKIPQRKPAIHDGGKESELENDDQECSICLANERTHVLIPCGHRCVCEGCATKLQQTTRQCPLCTADFIQSFKVFL